jgi:hypothetical protein
MIAWLAFTVASLLAIVYKAVMSAGSELTPFSTAWGYFRHQPVTVVTRFLLAQVLYFAIWDNPALVGDLFGKVTGFGLVVMPTRWYLALALGLASDKLADLVMIAAAFAYARFLAVFGR